MAIRVLCAALSVVTALFAMSCSSTPNDAEKEAQVSQVLLLKGGTVYDGTGSEGVVADVLIEGDRIAAIGTGLPSEGATVLDATGLAVCPGFIDVHTHTHENMQAPDDPKSRQVPGSVGQGVTTMVGGMDGAGAIDIEGYRKKIEANPRSANIARLAGHSAARRAVVGRERREATPEELRKMAALVDKAMKDGAFGLSSGLEYLGDYVTTEEVIALAKAVAPYGGYYETHLRDEETKVFEAAEEAVRICREGGNIGLCISHIKVGSPDVWHQADKLVAVLETARAEGIRVYSNWRPSINWSSTLRNFVEEGGESDEAVDKILRSYWPDADPYLFICEARPELTGMTLDKIAEKWEVTPVAALRTITAFEGDLRFEFDAMKWEDKKTFLLDPYCIVSSDGGEDSSRPDPMVWQCFPIFFKHNREREWLPMGEAVRRCTLLAAEMMGIKNRGALKPGMKADVVIFDPETMKGNEHWDHFNEAPEGIAYTIVNGVVVMDHGTHTGEYPGVFVARGE